jgi:hypothetical protein
MSCTRQSDAHLKTSIAVSFVVLLLLASAVSPRALAQEIHGRLAGRVVNEAGEGVDLVAITVEDRSRGWSRSVESDKQGRFWVDRVPVGHYEVRIVRIGYRQVVQQPVHIQLGTTTSLGAVTLQAVAVELDPVIVEPTAVVVDVTSATIRSSLDPTTFETLPTGRDYQSVVALLPQANESFYGDEFNVAGSTGLENAHFIDGANVTDPWVGATGMQLPYNFVQEIQLTQAGYEAEYGRALGGIVNLVTHSGGNAFEVNTFGYFTNQALTATHRLGLIDRSAGSSATYDVGLRISGPIARDRLWYSAAYNPRISRQEIEIPGHGLFDDKRTAHVFAGKLTWRAGPNSDIMFSILGDPTRHRIVSPLPAFTPPENIANPDPFLREERSGGVALTLNGRHRVGNLLSLEMMGDWSRTQQDSDGATQVARTEPLFEDVVTSTWEGGIGELQQYTLSRVSARLHGTLYLASHTPKFGVEYEDQSVDGLLDAPDPGLILRTDMTAFSTFLLQIMGKVRNRVLTAFLQDSWRVSERLTLNAGVRWDGQYLTDYRGNVAQTFSNPLQPRVGLVFQPGRIGSQKLSLSYGRFYQQFPLLFSFAFYIPVVELISEYDVDPRIPGAQPVAQTDASGSPDDFVDVSGARGEHVDELTIGYELSVGRDVKVAVRGIRRELRAAWGSGLTADIVWVVGNIGAPPMDFLPKPERSYTALELSAMKTAGRLRLLGSYVLSRAEGNYTGLFASDVQGAYPGANDGLRTADQAVNSMGLLPNDRTHVLKLSGSYGFDFGLTAGGVFKLASGTPLNEYGAGVLGPFFPTFLVERGSAGRSPTIWDLNLRFIYELPAYRTARLVVDALHIGSPRKAVVLEQQRISGQDDDGNPIPNPTFGGVLTYQPPMMVRIGFDIGIGG